MIPHISIPEEEPVYRELRTLRGHTKLVMCCAFSPDGRVIVSGSKDGTLKLWGVEDDPDLRREA